LTTFKTKFGLYEYLSYIEFAYNWVVYKTTKLSIFKVVYGFNPLTPINLLPLSNTHDFIHKDEISKAAFFKNLHEKVRNQVQQQTETYAKQNNKKKK